MVKNNKNFETILKVTADIDLAVAVRSYTFVFAQECIQMTRKMAYHIQQVVDELFINAVRYGSSRDKKVELTYQVKDGILIIAVSDTGTSKYSIKASELKELLEKRRKYNEELKAKNEINISLSGRGLTEIVYNWVDDIKIEDNNVGGITVTIMKKIPN